MRDPYVIEMTETGGTDVLKPVTRAPRRPGPGEVLVEQTAIGLNFIDTYYRTGLYPVKLPFVPGSEGAGRVLEIGEGVVDFQVGDRVAYLGAGTYSAHYTGPAAMMIKLPDNVSDATGAAVLLKGLTAWMLLFAIRRASPGETALVWAPAGGVGSLLLPWATSMGVRCIAVTSNQEKREKALSLGASEALIFDDQLAAKVRELTDGQGVDVSFDSVGKASAEASLNSLRPRGWWISYGNASGAVDPVAPGILGAKGSLVLTRPSLFAFISTAAELRAGAAALFGALKTKTIQAEIGQEFALMDIASAHTALEAGATIGATILKP